MQNLYHVLVRQTLLRGFALQTCAPHAFRSHVHMREEAEVELRIVVMWVELPFVIVC